MNQILDIYLDRDVETKHHDIQQCLSSEERDPDFCGAQKSIYLQIPFYGENKLLDVGPAGGYSTFKLRDRGFDVRGISIIKEDIDHLAKYSIPGDVGDMHNLPYENGLFSHILASHVLEHSPAPYIAIKEFYRVLGNSGFLVLVLPQWNGKTNDRLISDFTHHIFCVPPDGIFFFLKKVGFSLIKFEMVPQFVTIGGKRTIQYYHEFYLAFKGNLAELDSL